MTQLDLACASFRTLMEQQLRRIENMSAEKVDFTTKKTITIVWSAIFAAR